MAVLSARQYAGMPFDLVVGDGGSQDGSVAVLQRLERRGMLQLQLSPVPRKHADWLDDWVKSCPTRWAAFLDSDLELLREGWLVDMLAMANQTGAPVIGAESTRDDPTGRTAEGEPRYLVGCSSAPWIIFCDVTALRASGVSFQPVHQADGRGPTRFYDVASWQQSELRRAGTPPVNMPPEWRSSYRHFAGLSWRRATGMKGWLRHHLRYGRLLGRLWLHKSQVLRLVGERK